MKLDAGNPNLMKKKAMRVNAHSTLTSFNNTTGNKEQSKYRTGFVPIPKDPDVVQASTLNIWKQPVYKSPSFATPRSGADDHLKFKSVGNLT